MWAKKNAGGKEQVAKLVDDTYRSVLETTLLIIFCFSFSMLQMHAVTLGLVHINDLVTYY